MKPIRPLSVRGFTLIELMVVIVIMAIMASLILTNINGVDQRKAMHFRPGCAQRDRCITIPLRGG